MCVGPKSIKLRACLGIDRKIYFKLPSAVLITIMANMQRMKKGLWLFAAIYQFILLSNYPFSFYMFATFLLYRFLFIDKLEHPPDKSAFFVTNFYLRV